MDTALLERAKNALGIEGVFLRAGEIHCRTGFMPRFIEEDMSLVPQYRALPKGEFHVVTADVKGTGDRKTTVLFFYETAVRLVDGPTPEATETATNLGEDVAYVEIAATFCAQYSLDGNGVPEEDEALRSALETFGRYNVGYHVWPYWREYVQNTCARMGIPPIPVPMYRLPVSSAPNADRTSESTP
ncbi:conserved hypothetical protein [Thiocapsa sp. KS1]|nr:hypothetical protein [Thiocapsa sp. KS1]CRI65314.1 conserved hypothetical protein [Thiocapsa sp. KS1]